MIPYDAPLSDIRFILTRLIGLDNIAALPGYETVNDELVEAVLKEAAKIASEVFAPLNQAGDLEGATLRNDVVHMPKGFVSAYQSFVEGGWGGLAVDPEHGGQGLPWLLAMPVQEMVQSANLGLALCTLLNQGAAELLAVHGSENLRNCYLAKMVSGAWAGTMNLTEPQAGSDVGAVKCKALRTGNHYLITGQKIFISYGDHDLTENIIHLVLARLPDAPEGTKGLSLFLVPKILVKEDGTLGERNDVRVVSLEHKLGQHASPTCVMAFGDQGGAIGYLVGTENGGMAAMFTMMNNARIGVGIQGLGLMERSYQQAFMYATTRVQSRDLAKPKEPPVTIIHHPDVRRMLLTMKSHTEAARALAYSCAYALDVSRRGKDEITRREAFARVDLLTPIIKSWFTDLANEMTSLGLQVHGGMGFIEETGAAQHMRDARVLAIYEGTNGIQANDLVFRKLARDHASAFDALASEIETFLGTLAETSDDDLSHMHKQLSQSLADLCQAKVWMLDKATKSVLRAAASASPFLRLASMVFGGYYLIKSAVLAKNDLLYPKEDVNFLTSKIDTARFYSLHTLPLSAGLLVTIAEGSDITLTANFGYDRV